MYKKVRVWIWDRTKKEKRYIHGNLIGIFQYAEPYTPMTVGQTAGQIAYPVAVIDTEENGFMEVRVNQIENIKSDGHETKIIKSSNHKEDN